MSEHMLAGARVLVLGGSGVLGSLIAGQLHQRGAAVVLAGRNARRLQETATSIGPGTPSAVIDLNQPHHAGHVVSTAIDRMGGLDGVVNAAGVVGFGPFAEMSDETLDEIVAVDLVGPLRVIREALPHLDGGFVVNITGVVAEQPVAGMVAYSAVKAGLSAATRALAREVRRRRIDVIDARPPHTETGLAGRPITGTAPSMPAGLDPSHVASVIVEAIASGKREIPASDFGP